MSHTNSFSELRVFDPQNDSTLEGIGANVKLLLKLIQDHNDCCNKDDDGRNSHRVAGMISILDDVKSRIEKSQVSVKKAQFQRCNTDLRRTQVPKEKKPQEATEEENEKLRRELTASMAARKSLERMFSSLGKEKEIMTAELARKVHEMNDMEEDINDLKAQNEKLLAKVQACAAEHKQEGKMGVGERDNRPLQERNKLLSEQLLRSLDGYRALKRRLRETQEENVAIRKTMVEIAKEIDAGLERIHDFRERIANGRMVNFMDIEEELSVLERMFRSFEVKVKMETTERGECVVDSKGDMQAEKTTLLA